MTLTKCDSCRYSSEQNGEHCYECVKGMNNNFEPFKDCRNCKKRDDCPCGKKGHENGTSQGYSIGECKDYEPCEDYIRREDAINALRKALYKYEDETEKQFKESKELNLEDWFQHRIFVQNMNDIDVQTILELPYVTPSYNSIKTELEPCEDAISRKRLIILIDEGAELHPYKVVGDSETYSDYNQGWTDAFDWLYANIDCDNLPSVKPQPRWIPVSERLPKRGEIVLWCNKDGRVFTSAITYQTKTIFSVGKHHDVIAWMPLPQPYRAESEDKE